MAQLWKLPVIYVCENNHYGEYTKQEEAGAGTLVGRAQAFGIHAVEVDGQDIRQVFLTMRHLVERARRGEGPAFLVCNTYRFLGHHVGDVNREYYRSKEEEAYWRTERDPMKQLAGWMVEQGLAEAGIFQQIETSVGSEVTVAVEADGPDRRPVACRANGNRIDDALRLMEGHVKRMSCLVGDGRGVYV